MDVTKIRSLLFFAGVFLLGLTAVAGAMNHKAGTLHHPNHAISILCLGALGFGLLYVSTHMQSLGSTGSLTNDAASLLNNLLANTNTAVPAVSAPPPGPATPATPSTPPASPARDKTGWVNLAPNASQDIQAIYHLAEVAVEAQPALQADLLSLCRELNDKLFVIHHNVSVEVANASNPVPKNPLVAS